MTGPQTQAPTGIAWRGYLQIARRIYARIGTDRLGLIAAGVAFFGLLAVFPTLTALVAVGGLLIAPAEISEQLDTALDTLPPSAADILRTQIDALTAAEDGSLELAAIVALAVAFYSAGRGTLNLVAGLNVAYAQTETRGYIRLQLAGLLLTIGAVTGMGITLALVAMLPAAAAFLTGAGWVTDLALLARWPLLFLAASVGFALLYRFGPARPAPRWRWITPGAVCAVALWVAATLGFSWYVQNFGNYNETFGTLAGVIILMLWLWLSSFVLLLGAMLDAEIETQRGRDIPPPQAPSPPA